MNKKILIPLFATAMGLSLVGGISGAVAWYQYNTRVTASYVGASVAESGLLEIGKKDNSTIDWSVKNIYGTTEAGPGTLKPVTFGETADGSAIAGKQAYGNPEAGQGAMSNWKKATANKEYMQFEFYLRARQYDSVSKQYKQVAKDVYMSDLTLAIKETDKPEMLKAVRVHIDVDGQSNPKYLVSDEAITGTSLPVFGKLDLDQEVGNDKDGKYSWDSHSEIIYGEDQKYQVTRGKDDLVNTRDATTGDYADTTVSRKICTTPLTGEQKITVTIWLEGWAQLKTNANQTVADSIWNPAYGDGATVRVGMEFDVGRSAFEAA